MVDKKAVAAKKNEPLRVMRTQVWVGQVSARVERAIEPEALAVNDSCRGQRNPSSH